jgi:uncharacterized membrane protein YdfJ with MMPL/SSD domain
MWRSGQSLLVRVFGPAAVVAVVSLVGAATASANVFIANSPVQVADGSAYLTVRSTAPLFSQSSDVQLDGLHAVRGPGGRQVLFAGTAQVNRDSVDAITSRLPVVLGLIAVIMFAVLFLLTGSVMIPLKALVLNMLSLSAAFGAMVWIFQDGHLGGLGTTATGKSACALEIARRSRGQRAGAPHRATRVRTSPRRRRRGSPRYLGRAGCRCTGGGSTQCDGCGCLRSDRRQTTDPN